MDTAPVTLSGSRVRLEPLARGHLDALWEAVGDPAVFRWYVAPMDTRDKLAAWVDEALASHARGQALPFVTLDAGDDGRVIGATRFMAIDRPNRHVEIGNTWLGRDFQRGPYNTEAKLLMMRQAFEVWDCVRVEFKTDSLNVQSRAALARIGAREEGTFRNHMVCADGRLRHSVWFSVTREEWPAVKTGLETKLASRK
ncbi:MAG: GNAT family N-acetyltransferase [Alphaproteobacteria bacterium]|nr:GNAT family N-acetyltransferase [Alphaproteobacteria bacterium]